VTDERRGPDPKPGDPGPRPLKPLVTIEIENPSHYTYAPGFEPWDVIEAWGLGFNLGNVVKYVARHRHKGTPLEDLKKARVYLDREIALRPSCYRRRARGAASLPVPEFVARAWDCPPCGDIFLDYVWGGGSSYLKAARNILDRWIAQEEANR